MPRLRKARCRAALASGSSFGTSRGSASTTVTSTPKLRQADANSTPITPPPSTMADAGSVARRRACSLVSTRTPSISRPGSVFEPDPVASTIAGAVSRSFPTITVGMPASTDSRPSPRTTVIPRCLTSPVRPLYSRDTTESA